MSQKVLVVEDDNNIAELLRLYLQKDGFEVSHAADGGKAVEMAKEIQPDLVLLDIMLPVMDGWQVCREIRKSSQLPILMLTAKGEEIDRIVGLELGAEEVLGDGFFDVSRRKVGEHLLDCRFVVDERREGLVELVTAAFGQRHCG